MKGKEGLNLTGRSGNCAESTEIELLWGWAETIPRITRIQNIIKANYVPRRIVLSVY